MQLGAFVTPAAAAPEHVVSLAERADELGLDLLAIQDHPYQPRFLDAWTLLSYVAARTRRIRLVPDVANLPLRLPAVLARSAASLDLLSGGRVELGLGAGAFWDAIAANGGPRRTPAEAVTALEEAIAVCRALWSGERGRRVDGQVYRLVGAKPGPVPAHHIGLWIGATGPRMLRLTGRLADGWVVSSSYVAPERLPTLHAQVDQAAEAAGRSPEDVRRVYNVMPSEGFLDGDIASRVEQLTALVVERRMDVLVLAVDDLRALEEFATDVAPAVRDAVSDDGPAEAGRAPSWPGYRA